MRSFLFVPGDSQRKFENAKKTAADALILDLEDSIAPDEKIGARRTVRQMLDARNPGQKTYIRVNALDTGMTLGDLAAVMPGRPDGVVLPKCAGATDVNRLSLYLDAFEAAAGIEPGATAAAWLRSPKPTLCCLTTTRAAAGGRTVRPIFGSRAILSPFASPRERP